MASILEQYESMSLEPKRSDGFDQNNPILSGFNHSIKNEAIISLRSDEDEPIFSKTNLDIKFVL
ncbi:hypothetical protein QR98_0011100 [Sarcoptes scabiei]|uniref:Uncharacterized protein n=1 Tax=Sarcoptes scabiei TaxID=52283 RepID=A0A131ZV47_SARSC|nr:hypothetical protein QR98_0011100 [Sarcoptes scabiei]